MKKVLQAIVIAMVLSVVGLAINSVISSAAINVQCKTASNKHTWGFWPGTQYVTDHTTFCWGLKPVPNKPNVYTKVITSMSHTVTESVPAVGAVCDATGVKHWNVSGTINDTYSVEWEDEGDFKCGTNIPGVFVHRYDKMQIWVDADGEYCGPDNCPCNLNNSCGP